jgi:hypothetical protein
MKVTITIIDNDADAGKVEVAMDFVPTLDQHTTHTPASSLAMDFLELVASRRKKAVAGNDE